MKLSSQKQYMTKLKWIWPVVSRDSPENISSPAQGSNSLTGSPASKLARPIIMSPGRSSAT